MFNTVKITATSYINGEQISRTTSETQTTGTVADLISMYVTVLANAEAGNEVTIQGNEVAVHQADGITRYYTFES